MIFKKVFPFQFHLITFFRFEVNTIENHSLQMSSYYLIVSAIFRLIVFRQFFEKKTVQSSHLKEQVL